MIDLPPERIALITGAKLIGTPKGNISSISIDSRTCPPNRTTLFVALQGNRTDSHQFIQMLYKKGVRHFIVGTSYIPPFTLKDACFLQVNSAIRALQSLATFHRKQFSIPIIGITGSNGKTIVKEWLAYLLSTEQNVCKNPKSYNSQIGVPLSCLEIMKENEVGIFEAGISQTGEMSRLQNIIAPTIGIFTNLGEAHQLNFKSYEEKLDEKIKLFSESETIIFCADNSLINNKIQSAYGNRNLISWSLSQTTATYSVSLKKTLQSCDITIKRNGAGFSFKIPYIDQASIENAIFVALATRLLARDKKAILKQTIHLPSVEMRLRFTEGSNNCILINDCYNSDIESLKLAIQTLNTQSSGLKKYAVISDFDHPRAQKDSAILEVLQLLENTETAKIFLIGFTSKPALSIPTEHFETTNDFIDYCAKKRFENSCILIKGSRKFHFEKIVKKLEKQNHQTVLEVNLTAISNNLRHFKSLISSDTKIMAMVKGFSYGSGDYEIAEHLKEHKVDYLAVAFVDEGIVLREKGIDLPIAVMNPEVENYATMLEYNLEPEIYSIASLNRLIDETRFCRISAPIGIHVKIDTGMQRLGLFLDELPAFIAIVLRHKNIRILSVFSHLAGADSEEFDQFTREQASTFKKAIALVKSKIPSPFLSHLLNSAGCERFPEYQFDMVRLGIGLYGISSLGNKSVEHISTLKTTISQIKRVKADSTIGYSRKGRANRDTRIATLPIGYADGYDRRFSNGTGKVLVNGHIAPIIGNICMDACMVDLGNIDAQEGDEVILFSKDLPISALAEQIGTIPYEILTNISKRVKRIYFKE